MAQAETLNSGSGALTSLAFEPSHPPLPFTAISGYFLERCCSNCSSLSCCGVFSRGAKLTFPVRLELVKTTSLTGREVMSEGVSVFLLKTNYCSLPLSVFCRGATLNPPTYVTFGLFSSASFLAFCVGGGLPLRVAY